MKIMVTGGAGFIGSNTVDLLIDRGHEVCVVDNFTTGKPSNLNYYRGKVALCDITDIRLLTNVFEECKPEAILHLAAQSAISIALAAPQHDLRVNAEGTLNVLKLAKQFKVKRFIFSSTSAVYSEVAKHYMFGGMTESYELGPTTPYGISKLTAEQYIRTMFPNHMILRYANVYGPRQVGIGENQVIALVMSHFIKGTPFKVVGSGNQKRDFIFVQDVAQCNYEALLSSEVGTFNMATGKSHSVNEILRLVENTFQVPGYKWEHTKVEDPRGSVYLEAKKIYNKMGWLAVHGIQEGIELTADWWKKNESIY